MSGAGEQEQTSGRAFFEELYPSLRRFAAVVAASEDDPDDLVHDALVRVLAGPGFDALDAPAAYLRKAILRLAADRARGRGRFRRAIARLGIAHNGEDERPSDLSVLDELSSIDRAVVYLADVEGFNLREVAGQLGLSHEAARLRASRARRRIRDSLKIEEGS